MKDYTTDFYGQHAYPSSSRSGHERIPVVIGGGMVRRLAREVSDEIIAWAQHSTAPVAWVTGNAYMPPLRSFPEAETVWDAANNEDGELFQWFAELVENNMDAANVLLDCPEYDNALYAVDLNRWQYREDPDGEDLNGEWEQKGQQDNEV